MTAVNHYFIPVFDEKQEEQSSYVISDISCERYLACEMYSNGTTTLHWSEINAFVTELDDNDPEKSLTFNPVV